MAAWLFAMGSIAQVRHVLCAQTDFAFLLRAGQCEKMSCVTAAIATVSVLVAAVVVAAIITV